MSEGKRISGVYSVAEWFAKARTTAEDFLPEDKAQVERILAGVG